MRRTRIALVLVVSSMLLPRPAAATEGGLDTTFGNGGKVTTKIGNGNDNAWAAAVQPDGKILAVGFTWNGHDNDFALVRYEPNGTLDQSFGNNGRVTTGFGKGDDRAFGVALQPDGKIVVAGSHARGTFDFALARFNANGTLDPSFGNNGKVRTSFGAASDDNAVDVVVQSTGRIVAGGATSGGLNLDFALVGYEPDGSLDPTFGTGGMVTTGFSGFDAIEDLTLDGDAILAGGGTSGDWALARYDADGTLDAGFGIGGKTTTVFPSGAAIIDAVGIQPGGRIVAVGENGSGNEDFTLAGYTPAGVLDATFGTGGKTIAPIGSHDDLACTLVVQPDGKIVVGGDTNNGSDYDFALARFDADGIPDPTFGSGGSTITSFGQSHEFSYAVVLQTPGKIVQVGYSIRRGDFDFALARFDGETPAFLPDARITRGNDEAGDDVYNTTAEDQTLAVRATRGETKVFRIDLENEGADPDAFTVQGPGDARGFRVRYYEQILGGPDTTERVVDGTYETPGIPSGGTRTLWLRIRVKRPAKPDSKRSWRVLATSVGDPARRDAVKAQIKVS